MKKKALIVAAGGLGWAVADLMRKQGYDVALTQRHPVANTSFNVLQWNIDSEEDWHHMETYIEQSPPDVLVNTIGMLHDETHQPEKTITRFDEAWFMRSMEVNCLSHIRLLSLLSRVMLRQHCLKYIAISARVGSIEDNQLGGWLSYRCSKAALNMAIRTTAIEWRMRFPKSCVIAYHPGSVDTSLSRPFHGAVKTLFSPEEAAGYLWELINKLEPEMSGHLYDWQHERVAF